MPPKANPAKLNPLQLRTLTLLQAIAQIPGASNPTPEGDIAITQFLAEIERFDPARLGRLRARARADKERDDEA